LKQARWAGPTEAAAVDKKRLVRASGHRGRGLGELREERAAADAVERAGVQCSSYRPHAGARSGRCPGGGLEHDKMHTQPCLALPCLEVIGTWVVLVFH
jgi:hypothetical protein